MKTPEQWDEEGVAYAGAAKKIQDDAFNSALEEAAEKIVIELHSFYIARVHFKDGTYHDEKLYCNTVDCIADFINKCKAQGYVYLQQGTENTRIPYHNVAKITSNYCETIKCPCCGITGYAEPKEIK